MRPSWVPLSHTVDFQSPHSVAPRISTIMPTKTQLAALLITISNLAHAGTLTPVQIMPPDYDEQFPSSYAEIQAGPAAVSQKSCAEKPNAVWVSRDWAEKGLLWGANNRHVEGCIRYFPSHDVGRNSRLLIYLHGDRVEPEGFKDGSYKAQIAEANRIARDQGVAVVLIGRPGVYGSTGDNHARDRRMPIENNLVYAAIDAIKAKHGYDRIDLAGQSGGGYLTIAMLTMGRTDIDCAVSTSGPLAVRMRIEQLFPNRSTDTTGRPLSDAYEPINNVAGIQTDNRRRLFIVTDPRDMRVPYVTHQAFIGQVQKYGIPHVFLQAGGGGPDHHVLTSSGQRIAGWCAAGLSDDEIRTKLATNAPAMYAAMRSKNTSTGSVPAALGEE